MRNSDWPHRLFRAAALGICASLAASVVQAGTTETRTAFGRIEMIEEVRVRDPGEPPIMHVATEWTKLHLRWRSADGGMSIDVIDDGWMIEALFTATVGKASCVSSTNYLQYSGVAGEYEIEDSVRAHIAWLRSGGCTMLTREAAAGYARTLADGAEDFAAAEDGLRARARDLFKRPLTRCLAPAPPKTGEPILAPMPFQPLPCREPN
jgi:hypothetical protein